ncbi:hypothetical protein RvVAT039_02410 [Agrobacterium vitis]|uniref:hypothetical protein n=1 Tax=Agrobacterium vitis TaxID=373 RepID=UPI0015DB52A8|nr:hypothetical protein [Agrobacterium vitis]BCH63025.1 hypothetical protein RvVAT039_02410 [Agrobacterium vitis]
MNWAEYQPGRRVVCVEDFSDCTDHLSVAPVKGAVYTIETAEIGIGADGKTALGLAFVEFVSRCVPGSPYQTKQGVWMFDAVHFKPLDERRLDQFRHMLTKAPAPWGSRPVLA